MKMPISSPSAQNAPLLSISSSGMPISAMAKSETRTVRFGPIQSSIYANPAAPSPAVRFSAMPNRMISSTSIPNVPAA